LAIIFIGVLNNEYKYIHKLLELLNIWYLLSVTGPRALPAPVGQTKKQTVNETETKTKTGSGSGKGKWDVDGDVHV